MQIYMDGKKYFQVGTRKPNYEDRFFVRWRGYPSFPDKRTLNYVDTDRIYLIIEPFSSNNATNPVSISGLVHKR